jgi:hypothetical protein
MVLLERLRENFGNGRGGMLSVTGNKPGELDKHGILCYFKDMKDMNIRKVPEDLKNQFRAICIRNGQTMRSVIVEYMRRIVERGELEEPDKSE